MKGLSVRFAVLVLLLLVTTLGSRAWSVHPKYGNPNVMLVEMFGAEDAKAVCLQASSIADQVIANAVANGIPADQYELQFDGQTGVPGGYRHSIAIEIRVHAIFHRLVELNLQSMLAGLPLVRCLLYEADILTPGDINVD